MLEYVLFVGALCTTTTKPQDKIIKPHRLQVNLILRRIGNHAFVSGYDKISRHITARLIHRPRKLNPLQRLIVRSLRRLHENSGSLWYGRRGLITELMAAWYWVWRSGQVFHFVYGENAYRYIGKFKLLRHNYIICTYHTPPRRFTQVVLDQAHLGYIDAVIVVSTVSRDFFAKIVGGERVHYIPHGVDINYFTPSPTPKQPSGENFKCLFVGSHLRDFATLAKLAAEFEVAHPDVDFEVITLRQDFHYFDGLSNIQLLRSLTDEELREHYRNADLMVLPLKDATANNSVLEAMACGLPMVITDLQGVRDYVDEACARFVPVADVGALAREVLSLKSDISTLEEMAKSARVHALQFSFENVSLQTEQVYQQVASQPVRQKELPCVESLQ